MDKPFIPIIINNVLDTVENDFHRNNNNVTNDILLMLFGTFDTVLHGALELIESNSVTVMQINSCFTKTNQFLLQVTGSSNTSYIVFNRVNFCQCKFYEQKVLISKSYPVCKHFLAAHLAFLWNKCRTFPVDFDVYSDLIKNALDKVN